MEAPRRLVIDLAEVAWPESIPLESDVVLGLGMGHFAPAWSRMVLELGTPVEVADAGISTRSGDPTLVIELIATTPEFFAAGAGPPEKALIGTISRDPSPTTLRRDPLRIALIEGPDLGQDGACFVQRVVQAIEANAGLSISDQPSADVTLYFGQAGNVLLEGTNFVEVVELALKEAGGLTVTSVAPVLGSGNAALVVANYFPSDGICNLDGIAFGDRIILDGLILGLQRWAQLLAASR